MATIKNFLSTIRRFMLPFALNVFGFSVALAIAALILMQLRHELTFDSSQPDREDICLLVMQHQDEGDVAVSPRPLASVVRQLPGVEAVCLMDPISSQVFAGNSRDHTVTSIKTERFKVDEGFTEVFRFDFADCVQRPLEAENSVIIPESLAGKLFPEHDAVGNTIMLDKSELTVTGVYRDFPKNSSLSNSVYQLMKKNSNLDNWGSFNYNLFILRRPDTDEGNLADMLDERLDHVEGHYDNFGTLTFVPLDKLHFSKAALFDIMPKSSPAQLLLFLSIAILIIVIACINMTNFNTALTPLRIRSINTMKVLGSTRHSLCAGIIEESAATSFVAWLVSLLLVYAVKGTPVAALIDADISISGQWTVFLILLGIAMLSGMLSGIYPALYITSFQPALALKGNFALSPQGRRIRTALVGMQFFISFALLTYMSVILLQNDHIRDNDLGYDNERLLSAALDGKIRSDSYDLLREELGRINGVENSAFASIQLSATDNISTWARDIRDREYYFKVIGVTPGFFETIGADIVSGRSFREGEYDDSTRRWVFNESAREAFGLTLDDLVRGVEPIVGFVGDFNVASIRQGISPTGFMVDMHSSSADVVYIRVSPGADMTRVAASVEDVLHSILPDYPFEVRSADSLFRKTYAKERDAAMLISAFSVITVLICLIGVFSLVTFDSVSRRKEIAVRKVMGAQTADIVYGFNLSYLKILLLCFALSVPLSVIFSEHWLSQFTERIGMPWWVFIPVLAVMAVITCATVSGQCLKIARSNPSENLRSE